MQKPQTLIHEAKHANSSSVGQFQTMWLGSQLHAVSTCSVDDTQWHRLFFSFCPFLFFPFVLSCFLDSY